MINELKRISEELAEKKKKDPYLREKMDCARQGQSPQYIILSPIDRSVQDLHLLHMLQGDAFHGTRVPKTSLMEHERSPFLLGGPLAYNSGFGSKRAVVLTFESSEPTHTVNESIQHVLQHPGTNGISVVALRVDYDQGTAQVIAHSGPRDKTIESSLLSKIHAPPQMDDDLLVLICSDSRVDPPPSGSGVPMAIRTLGAHIPRYTGEDDETHQLNQFLEGWLRKNPDSRKIVIVEHGSFESSGCSCGAGQACLCPEEVENPLLKRVIDVLAIDASREEVMTSTVPEERVMALARATRSNLQSYPAIKTAIESGIDVNDFIHIAAMDTVTNRIVMNADGSKTTTTLE